ncbi:MAG: VWA domain-containing protein [Terracidiphilus sp.]
MKRTIPFLLLLIGLSLPALAAKRVTVAELEQALEQIHGKTDADAAWQVANLQLTERLSAAALSEMQSKLPGDQSKKAMQALADQSLFLDPPPSDVSAKPAPDFAEQRRIMGLVVAYVRDAIPRLPNFFATRDTTSFEDSPQLQTPESYIPYAPLHFINRSQVTMLYRAGREVEDAGASRNKKSAPSPQGLTTWGVFGPILSTVLLDAAQSKLAWSHWEQGPAGLEAIFSYAVPREKSHYEVNYCCVAEIGASVVANVHPFRQLTGYRGEMAVDPATGAILRLIAEAELKPTDPVSKADILVEYSNVEIAGKSYICPVRSISSAMAQTIQVDPRYKFALARQMQPVKTSVNEATFENYHVFRSDSRVLTGEEANLAQISDPHDAAAGLPSMAASPLPSLGTPKPADTQNASESAPTTSAETANAATPAPIPTPEPPAPEIEVAAAAALPDTPIVSKPPDPNSAFTLRTTTRLVDVSLVAYDKKGHPVTDLKPEDLEVFDNGQKQTIRFFGRASGEAEPAATSQTSPASTLTEPASFTNRPAPVGQTPTTINANTTILMIDASNIAFGDFTSARSEMLRFLKSLQPEERVGLYIMKGSSYQILLEPTADHATVATTLTHWMPSAQDLARAQNEEEHNRQQMEYTAKITDLVNVNGNNPTGDTDAFAAIDPKLRSLGSKPERDALVMIPAITRHLAAFAGHKSLVWVSSDNVLAGWSDRAPSIEKGDKYIDPLALQAQEALDEAHVSIYPLDTSQLEAGGVSAALPNASVQVNPAASPIAGTAGLPPSQVREVLEAEGKSQRNLYPGRLSAQMQQDMHPLQGTLRELAEATGGRALRRASDIAAELNTIVADGRAAYQLSFSPDQPADDQYHLIKVKVINGRDLTLRYRTGYLYSKEPATLKDRFRQAIWQARDVNEIGFTATPSWNEKGWTLSLNIAATDLEVAQQNERWTDQLDVFIARRDDSGLHAQVTGQSMRLQLTPATYQKALHDGIPFDPLIEGNTDFNSVRVVVVDENSGRMGSVTIPYAALKHAP